MNRRTASSALPSFVSTIPPRNSHVHVAVALARSSYGPQTSADGMVQRDEAFAALVGCVLVAQTSERERGRKRLEGVGDRDADQRRRSEFLRCIGCWRG